MMRYSQTSIHKGRENRGLCSTLETLSEAEENDYQYLLWSLWWILRARNDQLFNKVTISLSDVAENTSYAFLHMIATQNQG